MSRVDSLIAELRARHGDDGNFFDHLRPLIEKIFDPATPEQSRNSLLELAAETCERNQEIRSNCDAAQRAWQSYVANLTVALRRISDLKGPNHPD